LDRWSWRRHGPFKGCPAAFLKSALLFGAPATSQTEQALREYEVNHNGKVDEEYHDFEDADLRREFIDLKWEQDRCSDKRQILRPTLRKPEPDHLRRLKSRIPKRHHTELIEVRRVIEEELMESSEKPSERSRSARGTEKRIHDAVVIALQRVAMRDEHEQNDCDSDE
jgi:hypothetical protein